MGETRQYEYKLKGKNHGYIRWYDNEVLNQRAILSFGLFYAIILLTNKSEFSGGVMSEWKKQ